MGEEGGGWACGRKDIFSHGSNGWLHAWLVRSVAGIGETSVDGRDGRESGWTGWTG